ncbi:MAG TPA: hypothetical protein VMW27_23655 [Thermoanaerobaculia bacterium]|nr:hypothetical protein [Thermoanaerobaculia bacterium]
MFRFIFILYCLEAGVLLLFLPWSPFWDRTIIQIPFEWIRIVGLHPWTRGAASGFGVVHLIWALHDLVSLLPRRRPRARTGADVEVSSSSSVPRP